MLGERGVEWKAPESYDGTYRFDTIVGDYWIHEYDGLLTVHYLTPQQAIDVILGHSSNCSNSERAAKDSEKDSDGCGECHITPWEMERDTGFFDCMQCECGFVADVSDWAEWHFCPNCGCRIKED
jgi:hypothetical protein